MPILFDIVSQAGGYDVESERGLLARKIPDLRQGVVIADERFAEKLAAAGVSAIGLPSTEASKSLDAIGDVIVRMRALGANRNTHLWSIGGGAIQDVSAFVASVFMRGIAWSYMPTTLLGMVDSCIGGKSSINVGAYKNIVGTFHPPRTVLIDPDLTETLAVEQRVAGLAEAAKITFCRGHDAFARYLAFNPRPELSPAAFEPVIALSLAAKKWFIEIDEFDRGERLLLNFGHTFGHALEGASSYRLSHGVAVAVGVLCAIELSRSGLSAAGQAPAGLLEAHMRALLAAFGELPDILRQIDIAQTLDRIKADKKHEAEYYRFVTLSESGLVVLTRLVKSPETDARISIALRNTLASLIS
jgi:3-dehydroquinate synthase